MSLPLQTEVQKNKQWYDRIHVNLIKGYYSTTFILSECTYNHIYVLQLKKNSLFCNVTWALSQNKTLHYMSRPNAQNTWRNTQKVNKAALHPLIRNLFYNNIFQSNINWNHEQIMSMLSTASIPLLVDRHGIARVSTIRCQVFLWNNAVCSTSNILTWKIISMYCQLHTPKLKHVLINWWHDSKSNQYLHKEQQQIQISTFVY